MKADLLQQAISHHQAGELQQAVPIYQQILVKEPDHADANHLLGLLAHQLGDHETAAQLVSKAIEKNPAQTLYFCNLGIIRMALQQWDNAISAFHAALQSSHGDGKTYSNLGLSLEKTGRCDEAISAYQNALSLNPGDTETLNRLGNVYSQLKRLEEATATYQRALDINPSSLATLNNLGIALKDNGMLDESIIAYRRAVSISPERVEIMCNLAMALLDTGQLREAETICQQALSYNPAYAATYKQLFDALHFQQRTADWDAMLDTALHQASLSANERNHLLISRAIIAWIHGDLNACESQLLCIEPMNADANFHLGNALHVRGLISEAEHHHRRCLELNPDYPEAWNNLGNDLRDQGRLDEARYAYRKALHLKPDYMRAHSNLLFSMLYDMADSQAVYEEHLQWDNMHAAGFQALYKGGSHDAGPERKIRIGYMSPDFREHSVAYFIEPILVAHDHSCFEIYCFSDVSRPDAVTARLKGYTDKWLDISTCSDEAVAETVRQEGIDILVDLAGHTSHHRLMVFARKPAPVQVTYIGYPASTGMTAMDYRLTDEWADPIGQERCHSEKLLRLPGGFLCYTPSADAPQPAPLPYAKNGHISFGCFNHLSKVTPEVVEVWSQVLQQLPGSHLVLKHISLQDAKVRERYLQMFEENGVAGDRINILDWSASVGEHLSCYSQVDIALDTFPYNGTTTTCEALWMGVPVVCLKGKTHAGRVGLSLLESAGRQEWIAGNKQEYISLALQLAADPEKLIELRARLRQALAASSLCDRSATTHALEDVYRSIWPIRIFLSGPASWLPPLYSA